MTSVAFVARMAWREARAARRRLLLLTGAVAVGVAALVAINGFSDNLRVSVRDQAQALLGADLALTSRRPLPPAAEAALDTLARDGVRARVTSFSSMAYVPRTTGTRLVQVTAVEGPFPFYGRYRTEPDSAWAGLQAGGRVVVEPSLLTALGAQVGDTLALGEGRFAISGTVTSIPGDVGVRAAFGARVFIAGRDLAATRLLGFGSRAEYAAYVKLAPGRDAQRIAAGLRPGLRAERVRVRTVADDQANLTDVLRRLANYLGLVALVALLLGGIGTASAVAVFIRRKLDTIAILRCVGATSGQLFAVYLVQAAAMGVAGSAAGVALGLGLQQLLPAVLRNVLPVQVVPVPSARAMLLGLGVGTWVSVAFALLPLLAIRGVSPLVALRREYEARNRRRDAWQLPVLLLLAASVVALAALQSGSWRTGGYFALGIGGALLVLWLASVGLIRGVRRWFPHRWPYTWRQGLANLYRPANQTVTVVLALGFGAFLLGTLFLVQSNLLRQLRLDAGPDRPNLVAFDVQPDQARGVDSLFRSAGLPVTGPVPIVPMRIAAVNGTPVARLAPDSTPEEAADGEGRRRRAEQPAGWAVRREYRSTWRAELARSEKLTAGKWWPALGARAGRLPGISVEVGLASELKVTIGDTITWDVQGLRLPTQVTSVREVDWARFEPNFFVVFEPGTLEQAPQSLVLLTRVTDAAQRGRLQRALVERFSNVTTVDLASVQQAVENLVGQVTLAIRFMALFSLLTGAVVLGGAVATSRFQRIREGALLRTLGAARWQVLRIALAEYLALGLLSALVGVGLALGAAWALARFVFETPFAVPPSVGGLALAVAAGTALMGLANSADVVRRRPLEVLRGE